MSRSAVWDWSELWVAWQPIVDLASGAVYGQEALARGPRGSPWESADALFGSIVTADARMRLETWCRQMAVEQGATALPNEHRIFVNISSRWPNLPLYQADLPVPPDRLAIEVTESEPILERGDFLQQVAAWRERGHPIVLDDYGVGYAAAAAVLALQPDIVKLDRTLVTGIDHDLRRQTIVRSIREYTADLDIRLVAEGVETSGELAAVRNLGIDYAQGFLLARPDSKPVVGPLRLPLAATESALARPEITGDLLDFYAAAVGRADLPGYVVDRKRRVVAWNMQAQSLTGFTAEDRVGHRCFDRGGLRHQDGAGRPMCAGACPLVWAMENRAPHSAVLSMRTKSGERVDVQVFATPIWDPRRDRVLGAIEQFQVLPRQETKEDVWLEAEPGS